MRNQWSRHHCNTIVTANTKHSNLPMNPALLNSPSVPRNPVLGRSFLSRRRAFGSAAGAEWEMNIVLKLRSARLSQNAPHMDSTRRKIVMKNVLLSACAAVVLATGASAASAADLVIRHDSQAGTIIRVDDFRPGYGSHDDG